MMNVKVYLHAVQIIKDLDIIIKQNEFFLIIIIVYAKMAVTEQTQVYCLLMIL